MGELDKIALILLDIPNCMVIYNVTLKVELEVANAWVEWMKNVHMPDLLSTGLFVDCQLCKLLEQEEEDGITYSAQYKCKSINEYNNYIENHAEAMRDKAFKLFGGKFIAFRSVMEVI